MGNLPVKARYRYPYIGIGILFNQREAGMIDGPAILAKIGKAMAAAGSKINLQRIIAGNADFPVFIP